MRLRCIKFFLFIKNSGNIGHPLKIIHNLCQNRICILDHAKFFLKLLNLWRIFKNLAYLTSDPCNISSTLWIKLGINFNIIEDLFKSQEFSFNVGIKSLDTCNEVIDLFLGESIHHISLLSVSLSRNSGSLSWRWWSGTWSKSSSLSWGGNRCGSSICSISSWGCGWGSSGRGSSCWGSSSWGG